jgi:predicted short-subunit dehydrogenase-like oxidoreductase (DUF2520 family)
MEPVPAAHAAAERPARLRVGVVGAGRAGTALAACLSRAGHPVVAASGVSDDSRRRIDTLLPGAEPVEPAVVLAASDLVLLTVPDDALASLVDGLVATDAIRPGVLLVHASGAHGVGVLAPAVRVGALPLALHPVMTFTGAPEDADRVAGVAFGVTAPDALRTVAEALVVEMGGEPVWVPEESRPLYHAALTHGSNHVVTLINQTQDLLRAAGIEEPARLLGPLAGAALDNALRHGDAGLTGPVVRGDAGTVARHVAELASADADVLRTYLALARATADRALAAGLLSPADAEPLLDVLSHRVPGAAS